jgi:hypothetical protein
METSRTALIALLAICGVLIVVLSFLPWLSFSSIDTDSLEPQIFPDTSIDIAGTETSRLRDIETIERDTIQEVDEWCSCRVDFGDGYVTAIFGLVITAAAGLAWFAGRTGPAASIATVASAITLAIAAYNAFGEWNAFAWTEERHTEALEGTVTPFLWLLVASAALAMVAGVALWTIARQEIEDEFEEDEYDDIGAGEQLNSLARGVSAWA